MSNELHQKEKKEWLSITSLCLGIASVFLWEFSIVPILAVIFGVVGLFRDKRKWLAGIGVTLGIIFLVVRLVHGHIDRGISFAPSVNNGVAQTIPTSQAQIFAPTSFSPSPTPSTPPALPSPSPSSAITNPDYLKDPGAYLVDEGNTSGSQTPVNKPLWVEEVVDSAVLKVSYPVVKAGQNIIVIKHLGIPGLSQLQFHPQFQETGTGLRDSECMENASVDFMNGGLLHTEVYLVGETDGWRLLTQGVDIAVFVGRSGYGFYYTPTPGEINYIPRTTPESIEKNKKRLASLPYPGEQEKTLVEEIAVARLAKRGFWGTCQ